MSIRTAITMAATLSLALAAHAQAAPQLTAKHRVSANSVWQQSTPPQTKPDPKAEAKPEAKPAAATAASLAGKWDASIQGQNGTTEATFELKADAKDAKKVTGLISSQIGEAALEGTVVDGKLSFNFTMNANGTDLAVAFVGTLQKDGSLAGTLEYGQGPVAWTATRQKK